MTRVVGFTGSDPQLDPRYVKAVIRTSNKDGKNYLTNEFGQNQKHLDTLKDMVAKNPEHKYESYAKIDSKQHSESGWEGYNEHLFHGLVPDKSLIKLPSSITPNISAAGFEGEKTPSGITKESITDANDQENSPIDSSFAHPKFTTAHREATYSKLADEVFGLGQFVPKTAVFKHPLSNKPWSVQEFVKDVVPPHSTEHSKGVEKLNDSGDVYKLALMNLILGNSDRHAGNFLSDKTGNIKLIDNGFSFDYSHNFGEMDPAYMHEDSIQGEVPESVHRWLYSIDPIKLQQTLTKIGAPQHLINTALKRLYDAKAWSSLVNFGKKRNRDHRINGRFMHVMDLIRSNKLGQTQQETKEEQNRIMQNILNGAKAPNIPVDKKTSKTKTAASHANSQKPNINKG